MEKVFLSQRKESRRKKREKNSRSEKIIFVPGGRNHTLLGLAAVPIFLSGVYWLIGEIFEGGERGVVLLI